MIFVYYIYIKMEDLLLKIQNLYIKIQIFF